MSGGKKWRNFNKPFDIVRGVGNAGQRCRSAAVVRSRSAGHRSCAGGLGHQRGTTARNFQQYSSDERIIHPADLSSRRSWVVPACWWIGPAAEDGQVQAGAKRGFVLRSSPGHRISTSPPTALNQDQPILIQSRRRRRCRRNGGRCCPSAWRAAPPSCRIRMPTLKSSEKITPIRMPRRRQ